MSATFRPLDVGWFGRTATLFTHIDEGFDFLGQHLRKYDGKPLVKPSKKNTHAFLGKVPGLIGAT